MGRGRPCSHPRKRIVDAILYVVKSGDQWRMLPNDFPAWQTVYDHFSRWSKRGVWEAALDALNTRRRAKCARAPSPSYGIIDSQSVKTQYASEERGIDVGKKVKGRKRHIVVDILGHLLHVSVHAANHNDTVAACPVLERAAEKHPTIRAFSGDAGYRGMAVKSVDEVLGLELHISQKIQDQWAVLPKRWVIERTFAWLGLFRRLSKDVEILTATAENMIRIAMLKKTLANRV
ncbi:IS5 family transposase [Thiorhodococcus minor]|uniref:IS5 family transposase n=1 Tax=Thiorhodococcus minor TaxID=57489 RepID=UPI003158E81E